MVGTCGRLEREEKAVSEDSGGIRFQRANFVVSDLERALGFYCDVLGMSVEFQKESEEDSYSYPVFEIDRSAQMRLRFAVAMPWGVITASTCAKALRIPACTSQLRDMNCRSPQRDTDLWSPTA